MSDNGASHEYAIPFWKQSKSVEEYVKTLPPDNPESYVTYEYNWAQVSNTPFRSYKHWEHEGGISTPFIAYAPGRISQGGLVNTSAHIIDLQPTIFELAGVKYPDQYKGTKLWPQAGSSFASALEGKSWKGHDVLYWEHQGNRAVRTKEWKLVSAYPANAWELYKISEDRTELNNVAGQFPEKVRELNDLYQQWAAGAGVVDWSLLNRP